MEEKSRPIIVKKVKKRHGGHHGGSWKVAYADFVTAMMAFFLLMWLLNMASPEKKVRLSDYFQHFSIFQGGGMPMVGMSGPSMVAPPTPSQPVGKPFLVGGVSKEDLRDKIKQAIEEKLKALKDQVMVDVFQGGVRIQIVDTAGSSMFPSGVAVPNEKADAILKVLAENIKDTPYKIAVEGHTDSAPFRGGQITNWELSTARASAARRELEKDGIDPGRIARVVGYADTEPLNKENPMDPKNRRISILLLYGDQKQAPGIPPLSTGN
jgi:chemotaxis protein MotB